MNQLRNALFSAACIAVAAPAVAGQVFTMTFDDIPKAVAGQGQPTPPDQEFGSAVLGFYNGDPVYKRDGNRPWNTTFGTNALAICEVSANDDTSCLGQVPPSPSGGSYVGTVVDKPIEFTLTDVFLSNLSFYYFIAAQNADVVVELFAGSDRVIAIPLARCEGICDWREFKGLGESLDGGDKVTRVQFQSTQNSAVFDNITVTTSGGIAIPEPSTYALMAMGLVMLAGITRRRTRTMR
jgi:PEP-CTERM motif